MWRIHHPIRPVATDFLHSSCVIWHISAISYYFSSLLIALQKPLFHRGPQSTEGPGFSPISKLNNFRYCLSVVDSF